MRHGTSSNEERGRRSKRGRT